ncbi:Ig-like domain-containing protein [Pantoea stewartii]|uniref:Ig-like domain-containing protein n=1 Tax=Pantoea stewartii TaxID=66269 RepID=UPI00092FA171|nr:Ig-like domain-containing protein [Pantoea stewartii]
MAEITQTRVDIISRANGTLISQVDGVSAQTITLSEPSVVRINGTREVVTQFQRQGDDLIVQMRDGSTVRYKNFFLDDAAGDHSELVFDDGVNPPEHALFPTAVDATDYAATTMTPTYESLDSVDPLLLADNSNISTGLMTASGVGLLGLAGVALGTSRGGGGGGGDNPAAPGTPGAPTLTVNPFAGDNVLDNTEKASDQTLSGTTTNVEAGQTVTVTLGGQTYTTTVGTDGSWSVTVPSAALQALAAGTATIAVTVSNAAGTAATTTETITVEAPATQPGDPTVTLASFAGDNILDNAEKATDQTVSGITANVEPGQTVTVTLGGQTYTTTVGTDGSWSVTVPAAALQALAAGTATIAVTVSNAAGTAATTTETITVEAPATQPGDPTVTLAPFAGDNILDNAEKATDQTVSGITANVEPGQTVTVTLGGQTYTATVGQDGSWSVTVPAAALQALAAGTTTIEATVSNAAGTAATTAETITVEAPATQPGDPTVALAPFAGDNVLDNDEKTSDQLISGVTSNVEPGQTVTVTLGGQTYTATVGQDGGWSVTVPAAALQALAAGTATIEATVSNAAGTATTTAETITVEAPATQPGDPTLTVDPFAGDNVLDNAEKATDQILSGTTANVEPGQTVTVTLGGQTYTTTVGQDGGWSVTVPAAALQALAAGTTTIAVSVANNAGDIATGNQDIIVEPAAGTPGSLTITQPLGGDGFINALEASQGVIVKGAFLGGTPGQQIAVNFNGVNYNGTVDGDGLWSVTMPAAAFDGVADGLKSITVSTVDANGNLVTGTADVILQATTLPAVNLDSGAISDGVLNNLEAASDQVLSGNTGITGDGQQVQIQLGGNTYNVPVNTDGSWSTTIPATYLSALPQGNNPLVVSVVDQAGNVVTQTNNLTVDTQSPVLGVDPVGGDNTLSVSDLTQPLILNGTGQNGDQVTLSLNGRFYRTLVASNGRWSLRVDQSDLAALPSGSNPFTVTVTNANGSQTTFTSDLNVATAPEVQPTITVNSGSFAGDGILDGAEQQQPQTLTGTTTNVEAGQQVSVTLNGVTYTGTVEPNGNWQITLPSTALSGLPNGAQTLTVEVVNAVGNTSSAELTFTVDNTGSSVALSPVGTNNYLNVEDVASDVVLSGTTINIPAGSQVTVSVNGTSYTGTVDAQGNWTVTLPAGSLAELPNGALPVITTITDAGGNTLATNTTNINVFATDLPIATAGVAFGDGVLNGAEATANGTITGNSGVTGAGQGVVVNFNGVDYNGTVDGAGNWQVSIPSGILAALDQGTVPYTVTLTDIAGNTSTASGSVTVDTVPPVLQVATPSGDGVLNATEIQQPLVLTGTSENGATIVASFNGTTVTTTANTDGTWTLNVPDAALSGLSDGSYTLTVTATDSAGNVSTNTSNLTVKADAASLPTLTLNPFAGDNVVDGAERQVSQVLSGTTTNVEQGQTVTLTVGSDVFSGTVLGDGTWQLTVPAEVLASLADGSASYTVAVSDAAGNTATGSLDLTLNSNASGIALAPLSDDNYLNAGEATDPLIVSGTTVNVAPDSTVTLVFNGVTYTGTVSATGTWNIVIPPADLASLTDGPTTLTVSATDTTGAVLSSSGTLNVAINNVPNPVVINAFDGGVINADDVTNAQALNGTTGVSGVGQTVNVTFNGNIYSGTVDANGNWRVTLPADALTALTEGSTGYTVTVTDAAGNSRSVAGTVEVDLTPPGLTLDPVTGDDVVDPTESTGPIVLSGSSDAGEGQVVTIALNNQVWTTAVDAEGNWSFTLPAGALEGIPAGSYALAVTVSDLAGNSVTETREITVSTNSLPISIVTPFTDGYLNQIESTTDQTLSGTTGASGAGQTVTVTVGGNDYSATVDAQGNWSLTLGSDVLQALTEGVNPIVVNVTDAAGNTGSLDSNITVDFTPPELTLTPVTGDNQINAVEVLQTIPVSGTASLADEGQTVTVTLQGQTYQTLVLQDGSWQVNIPASVMQGLPDGTYALDITLTDAAGNQTTLTQNLTRVADSASLPVLTVDTVSGDNLLNRAEAAADFTISGGSTNLTAGQVVTVTLNGQSYTGAVQADGSWNVTVPAGDAGALPDGALSVVVVASDTAGNPASSTASLTVIASEAAQPTLSVDVVAADDIINATEAGTALEVTGSSRLLAEGTPVTLTVNGIAYPTTIDANGNWRVTLPADALADLPSGTEQAFVVTANDAAGNPAEASHNVAIETTLPSLVDITLSAGTSLNQAESLQDLTVTGNSAPGAQISVTLNQISYTALADGNGAWTLAIPAADLQALTDGVQTVTVTATDPSGNVATDSSTTLDVAIRNVPVLTLDVPFGDGLLSQAEAAGALTLTGTATNLAEGSEITVTIGDQAFTTTVAANGIWTLNLAPDALSGLPDGVTQVQVTASDVAGNPAEASVGVEILLTPPATPTVAETLFGDNVINASEAASVQLINGTTPLSDGQTVNVTVDGTPLTVSVDAQGNWTASLTPEVMAGLADGSHTLSIVTTDRAGNTSVTTTQDFTTATAPIVAPTLDTPFGDGRINAAEAQAGGSLSGDLNNDNAAAVTVTVNGTLYAAAINGDGTWSLDLPASVLQTLPDGTWPVTITVTDVNGNTASTVDNIIVAVQTLPNVSLNLPFGDGALNATEATQDQTLTGTTGISGAGQTVTVVISGFNNDEPLNAVVQNDGSWSLTLTPDQMAQIPNGSHVITVSAADSAGNTDNTTLNVVTAVTAPVPTFAATQFGGDNVLSISEAAAGVTLTGTTGSSGANQAVSIIVNLDGISYPGTVDNDGNWSVTIPPNALNSLGSGPYTVTVNVVDATGNPGTAQFNFTADLTTPVPTVAPLASDGFINSADVANGVTLTGSTGEPGEGQTVVVTLGGTSFDAVVQADGSWTLALSTADLQAYTDGNYSLSVVATDAAGNSATLTETLTIDTTAPVITTVAFAGDDGLDYAESVQPQVLSGVVTGAEIGTSLTVSLAGTVLGTGIVGADGSWSLTLTPEQMRDFTQPTTTLTLTVSDQAGNPVTQELSVPVDLTPPPGPLVTLGTVSGDNIISTVDQANGVVLSGTSQNLGATGEVSIVINGTPYATTLDANGNWTTGALSVADFGTTDGPVTITVNATNGSETVTATGTVQLDLTPPSLTINDFAGDNVINDGETQVRQTISGTSDTSEAGRAVTVTLNGKTYTAVVQTDGTWSTSVPASDMQALAEGQTVINAQLSDAAGNVTSVDRTVTVDTTAPLIQTDAFLGDNLINAADITTSQVLTGRTTGAEEGQTISLFVGDGAPIATAVIGADGAWSIDLTPDVLASLNDGPLVFGLRVSDVAGNQTDATITVNKVVNAALNLVVDSVFGDGTLSAIDTTIAQTITGTATSAGVGATVAVTIGGTTLTSAVGQDGKWAIVVPPNVLGLISDGQLALDVTLTDAAGNVRTVGETVTAIVDAVPVVGTLTGLFGGDNLLNIAEAAVNQQIGGTIENAAAGSQVTVTLGTRTYTTAVGTNGSWSLTLPAADLTALTAGNQTLGVSVIDAVGNVASNSTTIGIFTQTPTISLTSLFGDGVLNLADIATSQTLSGVVNNVAVGSTVTLTVGASQINAVVGANGTFSATVTPDILGTLAQGNLTIGATVTDAAGNTASTSAGIRVDTVVPTITLNPLFGDTLLNVADALAGQTISGAVTGAEAGSRVVVTIAGQQLVTVTDASGNFSLGLTPTLLKGLSDGTLTVGVSVTDAAGNTSSSSATATVGINNLPKVTLNPLFGDGVLNIAESLVTQTITGTATGVAAGSTVRLAIGNTTATAVVNADGTFSASLSPAVLSTLLGGNFTVSASVTDAVGNTTSTSAGVQLAVTQPTLTVNTVFGDGVLSAADLSTNQTISGSSSLSAGATVSATLNGVTYSTKVVSGGGWTISVPKADLLSISDGAKTVAVTGTDLNGNTVSGSGNLSVISNSAPALTITSLFGDNALSVADVKTTQTISGTATNAEGSLVQVTIGTQTFTTSVNSNGTWSLPISATNLAAIADGLYTVTASVTNGIGNSGSASASLGVASRSTPTVGVNSYFGGDGYLNISESNIAETISGTSSNAVGGSVTVNVAGNILTTTVGANGTWSVSVPSATLKGISDGSHSVAVTVTDIGGNSTTTTSAFTALSHNQPVVGVDPVLSVVTALLTGLTVQGGSLNAAQGSRVSVTLLLANGSNGPTINTTTDALGRYSANFASSLLSVGGLLLSVNTLAKVTITDVAGNSFTTTNTLLLGSLLPATTTLSAESFATFAVSDESVTAASLDTQHHSQSGEETAPALHAVSTLTTEADTVVPTSSTESVNVAEQAVVVPETPITEEAYSIGGVVITLEDGRQIEGATVSGSSGADTVTVNDLNFSHIDGGAGTDTLVLGGDHITLDLTALGLKVENIEILDLGKSGTNSVKLDLNEALTLTDNQSDDLMIKGADGSQVTLVNSDGGVWEISGERMLNGQAYEVYHNSALANDNTLGDVLVQHNLQVAIV